MSRPRNSTRWGGGRAALWPRSQSTKSRTSTLRHIQDGKRANTASREGARVAIAHVAIDARGVRPVRLDRDDRVIVTLDQPARDGRPGTVEFRSAVGGLAEQYQFRAGEFVEMRSERLGAISRDPMPRGRELRVGIVWEAGGWESRRSLPISVASRLAGVPGIRLY